MKIGIIGGGNMARAILLGLLANKTKAEDIFVADKDEKKLTELQRFGIKVGNNEDALKYGEVIILAVKPDVYPVILPQCMGFDKLFISIAAGISISYIKSVLGESARVVRVMPNTPALVSSGMTAICRDGASESDISVAVKIFSAVGEISVLDEKHIDAVVGVSGSGPALVFTLIEAMADGGVLKGLTRQDALKLAAQTVLGSAKMVLETGNHPAHLRDMVCSPGGTTIEGVAALEECGFRSAVIKAVAACAEKSKNLKK